MRWDDFCDRYADWSEATLKTRISSLTDIGQGEEVVAVVLDLADDAAKAQLVRKAMKLGVVFTRDDYLCLDGELSDALLEEVGKYGGFDTENLYFDENDFSWDDFFAECSALPEDILMRCIDRLEEFGESEEVADAIGSLSFPADDALFERAIAHGVCFTDEQMEEMGRGDAFFMGEFKKFCAMDEKQIEEISQRVELAERAVDRKMGREDRVKKDRAHLRHAITLGAFIGFFKGLFGGAKRS